MKMTKHDYEKVVEGIKHHSLEAIRECRGCPYHCHTYCADKLARDALTLIQEQREALREWGRKSLYAPRKEKKDVGQQVSLHTREV